MVPNKLIYADDSTLYASTPTLAEVEEKIRPAIDAVSMWAKENKMKMHPPKTKYSIISTRQKIANSGKQSLDQSGISLTLRTGPTGHATLFNQ